MGKQRNNTETPIQVQIFEIYYAMGENRSLSKLHQTLKSIPDFTENVPALRTLKSWSKKFEWQKKIQERDAQILKKIAEESAEDIEKLKKAYKSLVRMQLKIIRDLINELGKRRILSSPSPKNLNKEELEGAFVIPITKLRDLQMLAEISERLIKLDLQLSDQYTPELNINIKKEDLTLLKIIGDQIASSLK